MDEQFPYSRLRQGTEESSDPQSRSMRERLHRKRRSGLYERYGLIFEHCGELHGRSVLICGRALEGYLPALLKSGVQSVCAMVDDPGEAQRLRSTFGGSDCEVLLGNVLEHGFGTRRFDVVLAVGAFYELHDPRMQLARLFSLCSGRMLADFALRTIWGSPLIKRRLDLRGRDPLLIDKRELGLIACSLEPRRLRLIQGRSGLLLLIADK
ncbi:MAG: hypothetical protein P9M14_06850 [Candidatus Alcyoniella australis]|nr:hypothetical protein [Candidatus Alcyoniella australis]